MLGRACRIDPGDRELGGRNDASVRVQSADPPKDESAWPIVLQACEPRNEPRVRFDLVGVIRSDHEIQSVDRLDPATERAGRLDPGHARVGAEVVFERGGLSPCLRQRHVAPARRSGIDPVQKAALGLLAESPSLPHEAGGAGGAQR